MAQFSFAFILLAHLIANGVVWSDLSHTMSYRPPSSFHLMLEIEILFLIFLKQAPHVRPVSCLLALHQPVGPLPPTIIDHLSASFFAALCVIVSRPLQSKVRNIGSLCKLGVPELLFAYIILDFRVIVLSKFIYSIFYSGYGNGRNLQSFG